MTPLISLCRETSLIQVRLSWLRVLRRLSLCAGPLQGEEQSDCGLCSVARLLSVSSQFRWSGGVRQPDMTGSTTIPHLIQVIPSAGYLVFWASLWIVHLMAIIYG